MADAGAWLRARALDPYQLRLREVSGCVQARPPTFDWAYPAFLFLCGTVAITVMSWSDRIAIVPGVIALGLGAVLLRFMIRIWTVMDADGWHGPDGLIARESIREIVLFRGADRRPDFLRTSDGERITITEALPAPFT